MKRTAFKMLLGILMMLSAGLAVTACSRADTEVAASRELSKEYDMAKQAFAPEAAPALPPIDRTVSREIETATFGLG